MDTTPRGNEILDFTPELLPQDILAGIGLVAASSAQTESIIEMAIAGLLGIDGERGQAVTAHMAAPLRISVLRSAAEIRITDGKALDELDILLERIRKAQADRNDIVHATWCRRPSDSAILMVVEEARTHVETSINPMTVDQLKLKAGTVYEAGMDLMRFMMALDLVPELPVADRPRGVNTPKARKKRRKIG